MRECIPPNLHDPQRAKGSLDRRFEWFSLVTFFLQKKKVTRAGARNAPSRACRRNTCSPPQRRNPPRAKEVLKRSFKWFSLVTSFLQKKKVTRAGARTTPACARRRNTCSPPGRRSTHPPTRRQKKHKKTASRRSFSCLEPCPWRRARRRQLERHGLSCLRVPERHACRPQRDRRVRLRRVPVPPVAHQRHPP